MTAMDDEIPCVSPATLAYPTKDNLERKDILALAEKIYVASFSKDLQYARSITVDEAIKHAERFLEAKKKYMEPYEL